jgi:hypothetical protein
MITDQLRTPTGVEPGAKAVFDLDLGNLYRELWLEVTCAGGDKDWDEIIGDITLEVNGKPQRTHHVNELDEINSLHDSDLGMKSSGSTATDDAIWYIPIFLAEDFRKNVDRGLALGWNAIGIRSLQLKVVIDAAVVAPKVSGWGVWDKADTGRGMGPITKWKRQDLDAAGTPLDFGKIFDVGGDQDNFVQSLHLWPTTTGTVRYATEVELKLNNEIAHKRTAKQNQAALIAKGMTPQTSGNTRYDLVFDESDSIGDVRNLRLVTKQNLKVTFSGAPSGSMRALSLETGPVE